jgi:DeoR/GlpR family transcriptional regulator of sugar metabolism
MSVKDLSNMFFTSESSIRRDLTHLEQQGLIRRTYGGAVLIEGNNIEIPLNVRETSNKIAKLAIGKIAATLVEHQDTIFLDSSSTTKHICGFLRKKNDLTIITNGIHLITELVTMDNVTIYGIGGLIRPHSLSLVGSQAERFVTNFWASKYFFSCTALSLYMGAMDSSDTEAELRRKTIECCREKILLADHTKFNTDSFYKICSMNVIDTLITDVRPSEEWLTQLRESHTTLLYPDPETGEIVRL